MTHQTEYTPSPNLVEDLISQELDGLPELIRALLNSVMQIEREKYLQAGSYERADERQGYANGFKPKTVKTRVGEITFAIPQVREGGFYPSALASGWLCAERVMSDLR